MSNESTGRRRMSMPTAYIFIEQEDGSIYIQDGQGQIMTKDKMLDTIFGMAKFIKNDITDSEIETLNNETFEENMIRMAGPNWREKQQNIMKPNEKRQIKKSEGWIYFLKADNNLTKIGRTNDLDKRMYHFTTKLPYKLELTHYIKTDYTVQLEQKLHKEYDHLRVRGEWFDLSDEIMEEIRGDY